MPPSPSAPRLPSHVPQELRRAVGIVLQTFPNAEVVASYTAKDWRKDLQKPLPNDLTRRRG